MQANSNSILDYFESESNTQLEASIHFDSKTAGPTLFIVGGVHGNEQQPLKAMQLVHEMLKEKNLLMRGEIYFIVGNPLAVKENQRYIDGDLNRSFLGESVSGYELGRSKDLKKFLNSKNKSHSCMLDLHTVSSDDARMALSHLADTQAEKLISHISSIPLRLSFEETHIPGLFLSYAKSLAIPGVVIECGNHTADSSFDLALCHIQELLMHFEMLDNRIFDSNRESPEKIRKYSIVNAISVLPGFAFSNPMLHSEKFVKKGEVYARADETEYIAQEDGYILMPSKIVKSTDVDAGFFCRRLN